MERSSKQILAVSLSLLPLYAVLGLAFYWTLFDTKMPMTLEYQHDHFTSVPVTTRQEAKKNEIYEAIGGSKVYAYREICSSVNEHIHIEAAWTGTSIVWQAPVRTFPLIKGCHNRSYEINIPISNPARDLIYTAILRRDNNPLVTVTLAAPPIQIRALPPKS